MYEIKEITFENEYVHVYIVYCQNLNFVVLPQVHAKGGD